MTTISPNKIRLEIFRGRRLMGCTVVLCGITAVMLAAYIIWNRRSSPNTLFSDPPVWTFETVSRIIASPVVGDTQAYIRSTDGVHIVSLADGRETAFIASPAEFRQVRPPVICGNLLLVPEPNSGLAAFSTSTYEPLWRACISPECSAQGIYTPIATVACSQDSILITRYSQKLTVYDSQSGNLLWDQYIVQHEYTDLIVESNRVYRSAENTLIALDLETGEETWRMTASGIVGRMLLTDRLLITVEGSGGNTRVVSYNTDTLNQVWEVSIPSTQPTVRNYMVLSGGTLFVANDYLTAIDRGSGSIIWQSADYANLEAPVILGNVVYVRDASKLYGFDRSTGSLLGEMRLLNQPPRTHETELNPVAAGSYLLVPVGVHTIVAYEP